MTAPIAHFRHCPRCGRPWTRNGTETRLHCASCDFLYHFNPVVGVGGFLTDPRGRLLWIRRADDPAKGKLALPGGFVDFGETAEEALRREIREEVNLAVGRLTFVCSEPNQYAYHGITYPVLDLFFAGPALATDGLQALDGAASVDWIAPEDVALAEVAFPSVRRAVEVYRETHAGGPRIGDG